MAEIISGKIVSKNLRGQIAGEVKEFIRLNGRAPGLSVILVGDDPASQVYVRNKHSACIEVGIESSEFRFSADVSEEELLEKISELNNDEDVDGILVQLPLPRHIDEEKVIKSISPDKDVDAFSPANVGKIMIGSYSLLPCTPAGIMELLRFYNVSCEGKNCVVVGRSNIVGKPMALLLLEQNATVTICHSRTRDIEKICREADIIVVAVGKAGFLKSNMVKDGAVVIDVGINRTSEGKLCGDVDFESVEKLASMITPVPGGVGPMTITMLLRNTLTAAKMQMSRKN